jgi:acyl-CoA dehydrogenase
MRGKLATGRFFVERMLPETALHLTRIRLGAANLMELPAAAF